MIPTWTCEAGSGRGRDRGPTRGLTSMSAWILASGVLLVVAVVAEMAARWWLRHRSAYYVFPPGLRICMHPDPKVSPHLEPTVRFDINSDGERGDDVPRGRSGGALYRVLVAGGSQPEGYLLDQHTSWPGTLAMEELIRRMRRRWLRPVDEHAGSCNWIGKARAMRARATEVRTTVPDPTPMLEHFEHHLRRLLDRARAHADRVLVVRQP